MTSSAEAEALLSANELPQPRLWRAVPVAIAFLLCCAVTAVILAGARIFRLDGVLESYPPIFHRICCRLFGIKVVVQGVRANALRESGQRAPVLYVTNHASYLDVLVLGGITRGVFTAKSEVKKWPVIGWLASLGKTVYLERRPSKAGDQIGALQERFIECGNVILFAEGTSSDGSKVLPFRSSLFAAALLEQVQIQPASITYVSMDGKPLSQPQRNLFSWFLPDPSKPVPNKPFVAHMWAVMGLPSVEVIVHFHECVMSSDYSNRKDLAEYCETTVRSGLQAQLDRSDSDFDRSQSGG